MSNYVQMYVMLNLDVGIGKFRFQAFNLQQPAVPAQDLCKYLMIK